MKSGTVGALLFLLAFTLSSEAHAQQPAARQAFPNSRPDYSNYLVLKGGIFYPQGDLKNLDTGFNGELAYGFRLSKYAALEIGSGYFDAGSTVHPSLSGSGSSLQGDVYAIPLTFSIRAIAPFSSQFEMYGLAGGGGYYVHSKGTLIVAAGRVSGSEDTAVAGGFLGAGATYNFAGGFFLGLESKYLWTTNTHVKGTVDGVRFNADVKIEGVQGTLNLGFRF